MILVKQLDRFRKQIQRAKLHSDSDFYAIVCASEKLLGLTDRDLGRELRVSRSTISRWRNGASRPVPLARKIVYDFLLKRIDLKK